MALQYFQDFNGATTAAIVPIEEWNKIAKKFTDLEELQDWQKNIIVQRLEFNKKHPERVLPIDQYFEHMDLDDEDVLNHHTT